jgi:predicted O-linked N-acetylglucosamine transferase (SPINDLY family)
VSDRRLQDAVADFQNGRVVEAARTCKAILKSDDRNGDALFILALTEIKRQRFRQADQLLGRVIALNPEAALAWAHRGNARIALKDFDGAVAAFDRAIAIAPTFVEVHFNRAKLLKDLGRLDEALAGYDRCVAVAPRFLDGLINRGNLLGLLGRHDEALSCYDQCLALQPTQVEALYNRGKVLAKCARHVDALASYERVLAFRPDFSPAYFGRAYVKTLICDWRDFDEEGRRIDAAVEEAAGAMPAFHLLARLSPAGQLRCARSHVAQTCASHLEPMWRGDRYAHDRIRVAYLSSDFRDHAVARLTASLFERHDRSRFETTGVSIGRDDASAARDRLKGSFERFIDARATSDRDLARMLRELEIDIAVDLNGFTLGSRPNVFALRPAPVQVNYLGYAGTLGASHWDYIIADRFVIPEESEPYYAEKVVRLPDTFMVTDATRAIPERVPSRAEAGLPAIGFVFCCFNTAFKITPDAFDVWMRLLGRVERSILWLAAADAAVMANLRRAAEARGVAPDRLVFAPRLASNEDHLARIPLADLFLDTFHYGAHATAADALWAGVPVLTCAGATFASRVAGSLLGAVGLEDLVTRSTADYEAQALRLAGDPALLATLRQTLARNRITHALFDTGRFVRHLETAFHTMWEMTRRGEAPRGFAVGRSSRADA